MLRHAEGATNPANSMQAVVNQTRIGLVLSKTLIKNSKSLLLGIRPSHLTVSLEERPRINTQASELRNSTNTLIELISVITQLHGDERIYGEIRNRHATTIRNLDIVDHMSAQAKDKIDHAMRLKLVHTQLANR